MSDNLLLFVDGLRAHYGGSLTKGVLDVVSNDVCPVGRVLLDSWAVVVRHGRWNVLGWRPDADARRVLRVDRITGVETTGESCTPPDDLVPVRPPL